MENLKREISRLNRLTFWTMYFCFIQLFFGLTGYVKLEWTVIIALASFGLNMYYTHKLVQLEEKIGDEESNV